MPTTNRPKVAPTVAALLAIASLGGFVPTARSANSRELVVPPDRVPFELFRKSVVEGVPLKIGDLSVVSETEAGALTTNAAIDDTQIERCIAAGPKWLRRSADGTTLELQPPWGQHGSRATTALCDEGIILVGGYRQYAADDSENISWLFVVGPGGTGPTKTFFSPGYFVDKSPGHVRYLLHEVRAIDRESMRILFRAGAENGGEAFLIAPFVFVSAGATTQ